MSIAKIIVNQGDCFIGVIDSPHNSLDGSECKKRSVEVGYKCCFLSYRSGTDNVEMCYPISKIANLEKMYINEGMPENFKVDCYACYLNPIVYILAMIISALIF